MIKTFIFAEDGSVDLDELKSSVGDDVLVISYRQGATPPAIQQPREPVSRREVNIKDRLLDLMIEFDEMGFAPTTVCPDGEKYAIDWRDRVRKEFARLTEQEKQAVETLTRSFTRMETLYKVKCTEIEAKEEEISDLKAENAELKKRLDKELPCKVGDTLYEPFIDRIREWIVDSIYVFSLGINVNCERKDDCRWHDHFAIREKSNDFESRVYLTREAAEAKLAELKGGRE